MRNIDQFPITADEVREQIQQEINNLNGNGDLLKMTIGGVNNVIWSALLRTLDTQIGKELTVMDILLDEANL